MSGFYYQSDYAGIDFEGGSFYYGYEKTYCIKCKKVNCDNEKHDEQGYIDWCFEAILGDVLTTIPFSQLTGCKDMFNVCECLMAGIGLFLSKCTVTIKDKVD
jgi:hypothetical protein